MYSTKHYAKVMRLFHNRIKCDLIRKATSRLDYVKLLDVGVGRGGDMFKWDQCGVDHAIGYDPEPCYVEEANRRFSHSNLVGKREYTFVCCDAIENLGLSDESVNVVSCQFAIHYFFVSEDILENYLHHVSRVLCDDGLFIGTFMDGDVIMDHTNNGTTPYTNGAMMMYVPTEVDSAREDSFAKPLKVHLIGTLYFGDNAVSNEFVVFKDTLREYCEKVGLELLEYKLFQAYHQEYRNDFNMNTDYTKCSYMYSTFMFKKKHLKTE